MTPPLIALVMMAALPAAAQGAPPRKADVGVQRWSRDVADALNMMRASLEVGDRDELRRQRYRAASLVGDVGRWPDHEAWRNARIRCVSVPQTLLNFATDAEKGTARGLVSAEAELDAHFRAAVACARELDRLR